MPADVRGREIDGCTWALRLSLNVLEESAHKGRVITLPSLLRFFDRRWFDYITVTRHAPSHGRSRARTLLTVAYRSVSRR